MLKGFYLTLLIGPTIPVPAPQPVIDALQSAQVTVSAGQASGFQLTFALSKKSILNTALLPAGIFDPGIRVILMATVNSLPTVLMDGIITQQTVTPSSEPGQSTLSVTGQDLTLMMDLQEDVRLPWMAVPVVGIVNLIVLKYALWGLIPAVIPPLEEIVDVPTESWESQDSSDLKYINKLAEESGYVFYLIPGPLPGASIAYFGPEIRVGVPQPALNINMDADTNVESLSFTYDGLARKQLSVNILDPITNSFAIPIPIPDVGLLRPPLVLKQASALRSATLPDTADLDPIRAALFGLADSVSPDPITASGQLDVLRYGQPLQARHLVGVRGSGMAYDGLYYVTSVTHNIKRGEYKQSFSLAREGLISITPKVVP
jgi:hypothetical protein